MDYFKLKSLLRKKRWPWFQRTRRFDLVKFLVDCFPPRALPGKQWGLQIGWWSMVQPPTSATHGTITEDMGENIGCAFWRSILTLSVCIVKHDNIHSPSHPPHPSAAGSSIVSKAAGANHGSRSSWGFVECDRNIAAGVALCFCRFCQLCWFRFVSFPIFIKHPCWCCSIFCVY